MFCEEKLARISERSSDEPVFLGIPNVSEKRKKSRALHGSFSKRVKSVAFIFSMTVSLGSKFDHPTDANDTSPLPKIGHEKNRESFMLRQTYLRDRYFKRYLFNLLRVMIICIVTPLERDKFRNNDFIGPRKL